MRLEEEQARVAQFRISQLFRLGIDVDETIVGISAEIIAHLHCLVGIDIVLISTVNILLTVGVVAMT